jgi:anti-sigma factor RsiW
MTHDELEKHLRTASGGTRAGKPGCLGEQQLAAYADGTLPEADREPLQAHLADCAACLSLVGLLARDEGDEAVQEIPETVLARARALATPTSRPWYQQAPQWAAAALVLLALPVVLHVARSPDAIPDVANEATTPATERSTRSLGGGVPALEVLQPAAGARVAPGRLSVRWTAIPSSDYYEVRIVDEAGALVAEQRVVATEWQPDSAVELRPGSDYYVHVEAHHSGGKTVGSAHVPFRASD